MIPGIVASTQAQVVDPYWANVVSLLHFDGEEASTTFTDQKGKAWTASGSAHLSTTSPKFGSACGLFGGSADLISAAASSDFDIFGGSFTVDLWFRLNGNTANQCLFEIGDAIGNRMNVSVVSGNIILFSSAGGSSGTRISSAAPAAGVYNLCSLTKSGSAFTLGVNGASVGSFSTAAYPTGSLPCTVGNSVAGGVGVVGRIDDFRVTKGVTRYGYPFTPPEAPFPNG